jgi:hypothetical protein
LTSSNILSDVGTGFKRYSNVPEISIFFVISFLRPTELLREICPQVSETIDKIKKQRK